MVLRLYMMDCIFWFINIIILFSRNKLYDYVNVYYESESIKMEL